LFIVSQLSLLCTPSTLSSSQARACTETCITWAHTAHLHVCMRSASPKALCKCTSHQAVSLSYLFRLTEPMSIPYPLSFFIIIHHILSFPPLLFSPLPPPHYVHWPLLLSAPFSVAFLSLHYVTSLYLSFAPDGPSAGLPYSAATILLPPSHCKKERGRRKPVKRNWRRRSWTGSPTHVHETNNGEGIVCVCVFVYVWL